MFLKPIGQQIIHDLTLFIRNLYTNLQCTFLKMVDSD